jgi:hypothetical protein
MTLGLKIVASVAFGANVTGVALPLNLRHDAFGDIFCP